MVSARGALALELVILSSVAAALLAGAGAAWWFGRRRQAEGWAFVPEAPETAAAQAAGIHSGRQVEVETADLNFMISHSCLRGGLTATPGSRTTGHVFRSKALLRSGVWAGAMNAQRPAHVPRRRPVRLEIRGGGCARKCLNRGNPATLPKPVRVCSFASGDLSPFAFFSV